ncbi:class II fructose-bisphosphate aldolase [Thermus sp.]|uniref:class II fructose-bisphosphate aldolase n=1 Tax=Thermus sp. TaxID=275 RepID=UPI003D0F4582
MEAKEAVETAWRRGEALLAVNGVNLETAQAVVRGAERAGRPIFLMFSQNSVAYAGLEELAALGQALKRKAQVPVYLHLDHAGSLDLVEAAFALGFDSAMVEEGPLPYLEAARKIAGERPLEVELEVVPKGERRGEARPLEVLLELVKRVQPDWVAVDLGTEHKRLEARPLRLERLRALSPLNRPFVLHGASSAKPQDLKAALKLGVAKVNLATRAFQAFTEGLKGALGEGPDPRRYLGPAREAMAEFVARFYLDLAG